ncbi:MAG: cupredoxin family copper-binding protein [Methylovulum sp.]|nr:cupredoxin family copper-binding protein [Methylovulum sp.]
MIRKYHAFFALILLLFASNLSFAETVTINIKDFKFQPDNKTINLGDSVKWLNQDSFPHTSTANNNLWDSANLLSGASFTRIFDKAGKFIYHCHIHPGMTGTVIVRTAEQTQIKIGKDIITASPKRLPIKLNLAGKNADQVYLGSYIVNAQGGCADCHTCPSYAAGHDPYKGESKQFNAISYLAGGKAFGPFVSANLTPDSTGKPAGVTLAEFKELMRTGNDPDVPGNTLQVMPWPVYGMMGDRDLEAIYAYLGSIPQATQPLPSACP